MNNIAKLPLSLVAASMLFSGGCQPGPPPATDPPGVSGILERLDAPLDDIIFAQGQLVPADGVIPIAAAPGDRLDALLVKEGDTVAAGDTVGLLFGRVLREAELDVAKLKLEEAKETKAAAIAAANAQLEVADVGVTSRKQQLQEAMNAYERAQAPGGELDLLQQRAQLAKDKLEQLRAAAAQPDARRLVGETALKQQELVASSAEADLQAARTEAESAVRASQLLLEAAEKERVAAHLAIESAEKETPLASLEQQVQLLEKQIQAAALESPVDGTVLAIDMAPGQPTGNLPVMRIANVERMVCHAEVPLALIAKVSTDDPAVISGGGLGDQQIVGAVESISQIAGSPRLPSPDPRQQVDYRAAEVVIRLNPESENFSLAQRLVNSQVDVAIRVGN